MLSVDFSSPSVLVSGGADSRCVVWELAEQHEQELSELQVVVGGAECRGVAKLRSAVRWARCVRGSRGAGGDQYIEQTRTAAFCDDGKLVIVAFILDEEEDPEVQVLVSLSANAKWSAVDFSTAVFMRAVTSDGSVWQVYTEELLEAGADEQEGGGRKQVLGVVAERCSALPAEQSFVTTGGVTHGVSIFLRGEDEMVLGAPVEVMGGDLLGGRSTENYGSNGAAAHGAGSFSSAGALLGPSSRKTPDVLTPSVIPMMFYPEGAPAAPVLQKNVPARSGIVSAPTGEGGPPHGGIGWLFSGMLGAGAPAAVVAPGEGENSRVAPPPAPGQWPGVFSVPVLGTTHHQEPKQFPGDPARISQPVSSIPRPTAGPWSCGAAGNGGASRGGPAASHAVMHQFSEGAVQEGNSSSRAPLKTGTSNEPEDLHPRRTKEGSLRHLFVTASREGALRILDPNQDHCLVAEAVGRDARLHGEISALCPVPGRGLLSASQDGELLLHNVSKLLLVYQQKRERATRMFRRGGCASSVSQHDPTTAGTTGAPKVQGAMWLKSGGLHSAERARERGRVVAGGRGGAGPPPRKGASSCAPALGRTTATRTSSPGAPGPRRASPEASFRDERPRGRRAGAQFGREDIDVLSPMILSPFVENGDRIMGLSPPPPRSQSVSISPRSPSRATEVVRRGAAEGTPSDTEGDDIAGAYSS